MPPRLQFHEFSKDQNDKNNNTDIKIDKMQMKIDQYQAMHTKLQDEMKDVKIQLQLLQTKSDEHNTQLEHFEAAQAKMVARLECILEEQAKIQSKIDELATQMALVQSQVSDVQVCIPLSMQAAMLPPTADPPFLSLEQRDLTVHVADLAVVEELSAKLEANVSFPPTPHTFPCHHPPPAVALLHFRCPGVGMPPALLILLRLACHSRTRTAFWSRSSVTWCRTCT